MKTTASFLVLILVTLALLVGCKNDKPMNYSNEQSKKFWVDSIAGYYIVYGICTSYAPINYSLLGKANRNIVHDTILDILYVVVKSGNSKIEVELFSNDSLSTHAELNNSNESVASYGGGNIYDQADGRLDIDDYRFIDFINSKKDSVYFKRESKVGRTGEGGWYITELKGVKIK